MKNYAEKYLIDESINDPVLEILDTIQKKCNYGDNINELSSAEKVVYFIGDIESEINNGGISQYLFNSSGKYAKEGIKALKDIGAEYTATLLVEALNIYKNGPTNDGRNEPEYDELTEEQEGELNRIDEKFYEYNDDLNDLQIKYIKSNLTEF